MKETANKPQNDEELSHWIVHEATKEEIDRFSGAISAALSFHPEITVRDACYRACAVALKAESPRKPES